MYIEGSDFLTSIKAGYAEWRKSIIDERKLWERTKDLITEILSSCPKKDSEEVARSLHDDLIHLITAHACNYSKDEIIATLIGIKEYCRICLLDFLDNSPADKWTIANEMKITVLIIKSLLSISEDKFRGNQITDCENGFNDIVEIFSLARYCILIENNLQMFDIWNDEEKKQYEVDDILFRDLSLPEFEEYFKVYLDDALTEKPEEYIFRDKNTSEYLNQLGKTPQAILANMESHMKAILGFDIETANKLTMDCSKNPPTPVVILDILNVDSNFLPVLHAFAIREDSHIINVELSSVYLTSDGKHFIFGLMDLVQNIIAFQYMMLATHHLKYNNFSCDLVKAFQKNKTQKKMATFLSYAIADMMQSCGYCLPQIVANGKRVPCVEIKKIKADNLNILQDAGDLDVLAIDTANKKVIIIEIKYYQPSENIKSMVFRDFSILMDDDVFRKMKTRQKIVEAHVSEVVKFVIGEDIDGYAVESILLTARANFYLTNCKGSIKCLSWSQMIKHISENTL